MWKEGWYLRLGQVGVALIGDTNKRVEQKKEERIKDWKKGGKLGQVVGALKTEGLEPPFEPL